MRALYLSVFIIFSGYLSTFTSQSNPSEPQGALKQKIDLLITKASISTCTISPAQKCRINYTIENAGSADLFASCAISFTLSDGLYLDSQMITSLNAKQSKDMAFELVIPKEAAAGIRRIIVTADADNKVDEEDEKNNQLATNSFTVLSAQGAPDLTIIDVDCSPFSCNKTDQTIRINYSIKNTGTQKADKCSSAVYFDNILLGHFEDAALTPGAVNNHKIEVTKSITNKVSIKIISDIDSQVLELNETNNAVDFVKYCSTPSNEELLEKK